MEGEIQKAAKNLYDQKQLYSQLKKQYEGQCGTLNTSLKETERLRELVRIKEEELNNTERNLTSFFMERQAVRIYHILFF